MLDSRTYLLWKGGTLKEFLAGSGFSEQDITGVIMTHLHFDHAGGSTRRLGDRVVPRFPTAHYHIQRARQPNAREKASFLPDNFEPLVEAGQLHEIDGSAPVFRRRGQSSSQPYHKLQI